MAKMAPPPGAAGIGFGNYNTIAAPTTGRLRRGPNIKKFDCGIHDLVYEAARAGCPACSADREAQQLRRAVQELNGKLEVVTSENLRLRVQTDIVSAIREAVLVLDDNDLAFLKAVLYEWRDTKGLGLKTTHGPRKRREVAPPNGFIVMPRKGDPYGHLCTSIGGLAIAEYFDEATNTVGPAKAMELLVKGMAAQLPGAVQ